MQVKDAQGNVLAAYAYDGLGHRIRETSSSGAKELYYSAGWQVIEERQNGSAVKQNIWGALYVDELVRMDVNATGNPADGLNQHVYLLHDANFNITAMVSSQGQTLERYVYDAYGKVTILNPDGSAKADQSTLYGLQYLHQGGRIDFVTGLYNFRNRDYNPDTQRWMQQDPLGYVDCQNIYQYIISNPISKMDPFGEYSYNGRLSQAAEGIASVGIRKSFDASPYGETGKFATQYGQKMAAKHPENPGGYDNAGRHGAWQAELTRKYSKDVAKRIGDIHEDGATDKVDSAIDQYNNEIARNIGEKAKSRADVERMVEEALNRGDFILSPDDPRLKGGGAAPGKPNHGIYDDSSGSGSNSDGSNSSNGNSSSSDSPSSDSSSDSSNWW